MRRLLLSTLFLYSGSVYAQSVLQAGPHTPGRASMYVGTSGQSQAIVQDSGPASGGAVGTGLSELGVTIRGKGTPPYANAGTGPFGANICDYDAPKTNATGYHYFCLSPNAQGGESIIVGAGGGASQLPLQFIVNGVITNITGAVSSVSNSDGTLTISPTTGAVIASINLGNANTWTAVQTLDSPILVTPALGTPASANLINATGLPPSGLTADTISGVVLGNNLNSLTFGTHLTAGGTSYNGSAGVTITSDATNANTASTIVARDGSGNFNAGTITASLTGHASLDLALSSLGANVATALGAAINASTGIPNVDGAITTGNCLKWGPGVQDAGSACSAGGAVSSVANSDSSLTISPTTGAVVASLNVAHANTWSAVQTFGTNDLVLSGVTGSTQCLEASSSGVVTGTGGACGSGSGAVNSVTNSDGSLTISPTTGSVVASIAELLANTPVIGALLNTEIAAPGTPAAGKISTWADSTNARFHDINPAGTIGTTVVANAGTTHQWVASMSAAGVLTTSQPAFTDISGAAAIGQIPTGTTSSTVPVGGVITAGGPTGSATSVPIITYNAAGQLTAVTTASIVPLAAPLTVGTGGSITGAYGYYICTTTCAITLPTPTAGDQFCVRNDSTVTTVITISAITSVQFEKTTYNGYGTVTTGTMVSGGALGDKICLVGRDTTHYLVGSFVGTWTNS